MEPYFNARFSDLKKYKVYSLSRKTQIKFICTGGSEKRIRAFAEMSLEEFGGGE